MDGEDGGKEIGVVPASPGVLGGKGKITVPCYALTPRTNKHHHHHHHGRDTVKNQPLLLGVLSSSLPRQPAVHFAPFILSITELLCALGCIHIEEASLRVIYRSRNQILLLNMYKKPL